MAASVSLDEGIDQVFSWIEANIETLRSLEIGYVHKSKDTAGYELDLLANYPKANRNLKERLENKTESDREIARRFGKQFFDGDRRYGYGGFNYSPKFWQPVIPTFVDHWKIEAGFKLLDVGCAKGFMLYDFLQIVEGIEVAGIDISEYAIEHSISPIADFVQVADAKNRCRLEIILSMGLYR